jgi:hypothetical protein
LDKTGFLNNLTASLNVKYEAYVQKEATPQADFYNRSCMDVLSQLRAIKKTKNPELILKIEKTLIDNDFARFSGVPHIEVHMRNARQELAEAFEALEIVRNPGEHGVLFRGMSHKDKQKGLPLDGFRRFERSHQQRLINLKSGVAHHLESRIYDQRKDNLKACREIYIGMQRQALGLAPGLDSEMEL